MIHIGSICDLTNQMNRYELHSPSPSRFTTQFQRGIAGVLNKTTCVIQAENYHEKTKENFVPRAKSSITLQPLRHAGATYLSHQ